MHESKIQRKRLMFKSVDQFKTGLSLLRVMRFDMWSKNQPVRIIYIKTKKLYQTSGKTPVN